MKSKLMALTEKQAGELNHDTGCGVKSEGAVYLETHRTAWHAYNVEETQTSIDGVEQLINMVLLMRQAVRIQKGSGIFSCHSIPCRLDFTENRKSSFTFEITHKR